MEWGTVVGAFITFVGVFAFAVDSVESVLTLATSATLGTVINDAVLGQTTLVLTLVAELVALVLLSESGAVVRTLCVDTDFRLLTIVSGCASALINVVASFWSADTSDKVVNRHAGITLITLTIVTRVTYTVESFLLRVIGNTSSICMTVMSASSAHTQRIGDTDETTGNVVTNVSYLCAC